MSETSKYPKGFRQIRAAAIVLLVLSVAVIAVSYLKLRPGDAVGETEYSTYQYHIAMIADDAGTSFWREVYDSAVKAGAEYGAYVEQVGDGLVEEFSMEDAFNMAIYEGVDGILLRPAEGRENEKMIEKAQSYGIPVITMQKDVQNSGRQGFVGINDYFLGQEYGKRVLEIADPDTVLVTVLFPGDSFNESSQNWFRLGISNTVQQENLFLDFQIIQDDKGLNNAEDLIHEMAEGKTVRPDIIICLDEVITLSAYQLIRDSGLSGEIRMIGSSVSDDILAAIENGDIDSTITIDPEDLAVMSIDALMTYKEHRMVSYYTEVETVLIDREQAVALRKERADEQTK